MFKLRSGQPSFLKRSPAHRGDETGPYADKAAESEDRSEGVALLGAAARGCPCRFVTQPAAGGKRPSLALESIRPVAEKLAILVKG